MNRSVVEAGICCRDPAVIAGAGWRSPPVRRSVREDDISSLIPAGVTWADATTVSPADAEFTAAVGLCACACNSAARPRRATAGGVFISHDIMADGPTFNPGG